MRNIDLRAVTDDGLIDRFVIAAQKLGRAILDSENREANRMYHFMRAIDLELRHRGTDSRLRLAPLLGNPNRFVRYYAAQKLLGLLPERSRAIIETNYRKGFDAIAGDAGMLLAAIDSGQYKPD